MTLEGPAVNAGRLPLSELALLAQQLQTAVDRVGMVLTGEMTSARPGQRPREVRDLCRLELVAARSGSVVLELDLARDQLPLESLDLGVEAVGRLVEGMREVTDGAEDGALPAGWDVGVLMAWRELGSLFHRGVEGLRFESRARGRAASATFTSREHRLIVERIQAPVVNRRTVEGRLLMADFRETGRACRILQPGGRWIPCSFGEEQTEAVYALLRQYVRVTGEAEWDEGGNRLVRIAIADIEPVEPAPETTEAPSYPFWEGLPLEELVELQEVGPVHRLEDVASDLWDGKDVDAFLELVRKPHVRA